MAEFWFEHRNVKSFSYCRRRMESKTLTSFTMCLNKALQAMHISLLKPTWGVAWCGIGRQELMLDITCSQILSCLPLHKSPLTSTVSYDFLMKFIPSFVCMRKTLVILKDWWFWKTTSPVFKHVWTKVFYAWSDDRHDWIPQLNSIFSDVDLQFRSLCDEKMKMEALLLFAKFSLDSDKIHFDVETCWLMCPFCLL